MRRRREEAERRRESLSSRLPLLTERRTELSPSSRLLLGGRSLAFGLSSLRTLSSDSELASTPRSRLTMMFSASRARATPST